MNSISKSLAVTATAIEIARSARVSVDYSVAHNFQNESAISLAQSLLEEDAVDVEIINQIEQVAAMAIAEKESACARNGSNLMLDETIPTVQSKWELPVVSSLLALIGNATKGSTFNRPSLKRLLSNAVHNKMKPQYKKILREMIQRKVLTVSLTRFQHYVNDADGEYEATAKALNQWIRKLGDPERLRGKDHIRITFTPGLVLPLQGMAVLDAIETVNYYAHFDKVTERSQENVIQAVRKELNNLKEASDNCELLRASGVKCKEVFSKKVLDNNEKFSHRIADALLTDGSFRAKHAGNLFNMLGDIKRTWAIDARRSRIKFLVSQGLDLLLSFVDDQKEQRVELKEMETKLESDYQDEFVTQVDAGKAPVALLIEQATALESGTVDNQVNESLLEKFVDDSPVALAYVLQNPRVKDNAKQIIAKVVDYLIDGSNIIEMRHFDELGNQTVLLQEEADLALAPEQLQMVDCGTANMFSRSLLETIWAKNVQKKKKKRGCCRCKCCIKCCGQVAEVGEVVEEVVEVGEEVVEVRDAVSNAGFDCDCDCCSGIGCCSNCSNGSCSCGSCD